MNGTRPCYNYKIIEKSGAHFQDMCKEALSVAALSSEQVLRITIFGAPSSNEQYSSHLNFISQNIYTLFGDTPPVYSYVAQRPLLSDLTVEVVSVKNSGEFKINYKSIDSHTYLTIESGSFLELFAGSVMLDPVNMGIVDQSFGVFELLDKMLKTEGMQPSDIVRQWNYIERITEFEGNYQHYQAFNDARTHFYADTKWQKGYPAATGIGVARGGIMIDFNAIKGDQITILALDNSLQVPAHVYSQEVLLGAEDKTFKNKTTPKFERGKAVISEGSSMSYISGTAAIRGEDSLESVDVITQNTITMENIDFLVSCDNLKKNGLQIKLNNPVYQLLRVYVKNQSDCKEVEKYMTDNYPIAEKCYLHADVCREELLIEIEGIASYAMN